MNEEIKPEAKRPPWECAARKQGTAGGNDAADCDWPCCGCDTYANKVMAALDEAGFELIKKRSEPAAAPQEHPELRQHEEAFYRLIRSLLTDVAVAKLGVASGRASDLLHKLKYLQELRARLVSRPDRGGA